MPVTIRSAERIRRLPPYLFAEIDRLKRRSRPAASTSSTSASATPTRRRPAHIVARLAEAAANPQNHRYPDYEGLPSFRQAPRRASKRRYGVTLDPDTEVVSLIGSKEGIANLAVAFVDPGDVVLVPDPGYPGLPHRHAASTAASSTRCRSGARTASSPTSAPSRPRSRGARS